MLHNNNPFDALVTFGKVAAHLRRDLGIFAEAPVLRSLLQALEDQPDLTVPLSFLMDRAAAAIEEDLILAELN